MEAKKDAEWARPRRNGGEGAWTGLSSVRGLKGPRAGEQQSSFDGWPRAKTPGKKRPEDAWRSRSGKTTRLNWRSEAYAAEVRQLRNLLISAERCASSIHFNRSGFPRIIVARFLTMMSSFLKALSGMPWVFFVISALITSSLTYSRLSTSSTCAVTRCSPCGGVAPPFPFFRLRLRSGHIGSVQQITSLYNRCVPHSTQSDVSEANCFPTRSCVTVHQP